MPGAIISPGSAIAAELKPGSGGRLGRLGRPVEDARLQLSAPEVRERLEAVLIMIRQAEITLCVTFRDCAAQNRGFRKTKLV